MIRRVARQALLVVMAKTIPDQGRLRPFSAAGGNRPAVYGGSWRTTRLSLPVFPAAADSGGGGNGERRWAVANPC